jgi:tetratricopeptide (TPR) repeat protein
MKVIDAHHLAAAVLVALGLPAALPAQQHSHATTAPAAVQLYDNLGSHHYAVTARNPLAQRYFDQGLRLAWAFNHGEAVRAFEEAERQDSSCAMCAWGVAYALGPNINMGMDSASGVKAWRAISRARSGAGKVSPRERALIEALAARYAPVPPADRAALDSAWARKIGAAADRVPEDAEIQVIHADAIMNLSPWNYWTTAGAPRAGTAMILSRLERVLAANPNHPGACHLFIHAVEANEPARALPCAERLAALMPGAGHLVHMPGHIYIRVGRYEDAIRVNEHAVHADGSLLEGPGVARRGVYANGYYPHNYHFLSFAASMLGMGNTAIQAARETAKRLDRSAVEAVPWVESVTPILPVTLVTFGKWKEILAAPEPAADAMPFQAAMTWYARGVAHAATASAPEARRALEQVRRIAAKYPKNDNGTALQIAIHALQGEIALRCGTAADAVRHFREAAKLEDALTYNEPPTWYYPIRHSLGAALLATGEAVEAERVYREDLKRFPDNGWSLFGLAQSLERQGRTREAAQARRAFDKAWKKADIKLTSSRL